MKEMDNAYLLKKIYDRLMEEEEPKKNQKEKVASVVEQLDSKLGPRWREEINPEGMNLVDIVPPKKCEYREEEEEEATFFNKVRDMMLGENMEVGDVIDKTPLDKQKYHRPGSRPKTEKGRSLMDMIDINISVKSGQAHGNPKGDC